MTLTTERLREIASSPSFSANPLSHEVKYMARELLANREAQPVAYAVFADNGNIRIWSTDKGITENVGVPVPLYTAPPAPAVPDDVQRDSDRWRAMLGSARIRILGTAGFDATAFPGGAPDCRHFGMEIWTHYPGWMTEKNEYGIDTLTKYADACRAAMLAQPVSQRYTLPPHVFRELVNSLRDTAVKYQGTQQLREQLKKTLKKSGLLTQAQDNS